MITRENYQEFFLLYVDNELSAADASAVEEWVAANPDLMEEWESLLFCRVDPDEKVIFPGKEGLLRAGEDGLAGTGEDGLQRVVSPTGTGGYPEYLLSYIDGELGPAEREQAEARIAASAADAAELQQLLMTVSKPDVSVVFPDKSSLYRKEKDRRVIELRRSVVPRDLRRGLVSRFFPVVPFERRRSYVPRSFSFIPFVNSGTSGTSFLPFGPSFPSGIFRAVAGAAAVILIAVPLLIKKPAQPVTPGGAVALQDKNAGRQRPEAVNTQDPGATRKPNAIAKTADPVAAREPQIQHEPQEHSEPQVVAKIQDTRSAREPGIEREAGAKRDPGTKWGQGTKRNPGSQREPQIPREPQIQRDLQVQRDPQIQREAQVSHEPRPATDVAVTVGPPDQAVEVKSTGMAIAARQVDIPKEQSSFATQALLQEDDEKALASANHPTGKSKIRGFFRKVTRTFGSTAERDGDGRREVLISAFQVAVN